MKRNNLMFGSLVLSTLCLSPDAEQGGGADQPIADPTLAAPEPAVDPVLTNDLDDVKTEEPLWPANDYPMTCVKITEKTSPKSGGKYLNVQLKTIQPHTAVNGEIVPVGKTMFGRIMITPTEKLGIDEIKRQLKRFMVCFGITSGPVYPLTQFEGKTGMVKVGMTKPTDEYPEVRNEVKSFVAAK